ncbi:hypothetical protein EYC84_011625 [Monilinia fructicola]|uniref:Uncharacterized protein n=1 Tax=Monilinia fructicola TaxID=38448 RepID=A0A5M9J6J6_MONFR|nr:hypothetical protein EYC84_011625 [Monilinia fructicola]
MPYQREPESYLLVPRDLEPYDKKTWQKQKYYLAMSNAIRAYLEDNYDFHLSRNESLFSTVSQQQLQKLSISPMQYLQAWHSMVLFVPLMI